MKKNMMMLLCLLVSSLMAGTNVVQNSDFSASDDQGRPASWQCHLGNCKILPGGIRGQKMLELTTFQYKEGQFKGTLVQSLSQLKAGDYILSGYFRGDASALWIVLNYGDKPALKLWLSKGQFQASDVPDWWRFSSKINIPEDSPKGVLVIEPFSQSQGEKICLSNILLEYQED